MSKLQRIRSIVIGLIMLLVALTILSDPKDGYHIVALILTFSFLVAGFRYLIYYFRMARQMVGGKRILYLSLIILDFAVLTFSMTQFPSTYVVLYLLAIYAFSGLVHLMQANQARQMQSPAWFKDALQGLFDLGIVAACLYNLHNPQVLTVIYAMGMTFSAFRRIISGFKKTSIVYIP